jgi:pimeloyl-ACP methyl ester carboxylesterase
MRWGSRPEATEYLRARAPYDSWDPTVFAGWAQTGLIDSTDGGAELSCPPWVEASVFAETRGSRAAADLARIHVPTWVARATGDRGMRSTCGPDVARAIAGARETVVEGSGHFLPLEDIPLVVRLLNEACTTMSR